jgi:RHS repeat-associated protein
MPRRPRVVVPGVAHHVTAYQTFDPTTNRLTGGGTSYDANGNLLTMAGGLTMTYDEENRMVQAVNSSNATETNIYNPSGQLVYRQRGSATPELYIWGPLGQRIRLTYGVIQQGYSFELAYEDQELSFAGKLLEADDRIGTSVVTPGPTGRDGRTFPYGELRSAPSSGGNRYATYLLDGTTNLNYAQHRWYSSQVARFTTVDPTGRANLKSPQSWNQYGYAGGDPINKNDPRGLCNVVIGGITQNSSQSSAINSFATENGSIEAFPYAGGNLPEGLASVAGQGLLTADSATKAAAVAIWLASIEDPNEPIDVTTFSGGAEAFSAAMAFLPSLKGRIGNVTYVSPGASGFLFAGATTTAVMGTNGFKENAVDLTGTLFLPGNTRLIETICGHDFGCQLAHAEQISWNVRSACPSPLTVSSPPPIHDPIGGILSVFGQLELVWSSISYPDVHSTITYPTIDQP